MIARVKILFVAIVLFFISVDETKVFVCELKYDTEKTVEYVFEECEEKENQSDEFINTFFTYSASLGDIIEHSYCQQRYTFEFPITLFKPPIAS